MRYDGQDGWLVITGASAASGIASAATAEPHGEREGTARAFD